MNCAVRRDATEYGCFTSVGTGHAKRNSVQRAQCWWLPYLVMEFEVNQILIYPLGGELAKPLYMYQAHFDMSRNSEISIQAYIRKDEPGRGSEDAHDVGNDLHLGGISFMPDLDNLPSQDQWYELQGGAGKILIGVAFQPNSVRIILCSVGAQGLITYA